MYGAIPILCEDPEKAEILSCGSIVGVLPRTYSGIVLGSGLMDDTTAHQLPYARILALRGRLTKERLGVVEDVVLGDPGLLAVDLTSKRIKKRFKLKLGIVPHAVDYRHPFVWTIARRHPKQVAVVNVQRSVRHVIQQIQQCEHILSSSLHGVVVADALDIPSRWTILSDRVIGKGFKFRDYYSAFGVDQEPMRVTDKMTLSDILEEMLPPPSGVHERQDTLRILFQRLCGNLAERGRHEPHGCTD